MPELLMYLCKDGLRADLSQNRWIVYLYRQIINILSPDLLFSFYTVDFSSFVLARQVSYLYIKPTNFIRMAELFSVHPKGEKE